MTPKAATTAELAVPNSKQLSVIDGCLEEMAAIRRTIEETRTFIEEAPITRTND